MDDGGVWVKLDEASVSNNSGTGSNLLYNGAMQVHQRGTSATGIGVGGGYYTVDRWNSTVGDSTFTHTVESDVPTGVGFAKSFKTIVTTPTSSLSANNADIFFQSLEGQDLQRLAKGTGQPKELTVSFWVKSNVVGTYTVELFDRDNSRTVSKQYEISVSGSWEFKVITFPGDTSGTFDNDNNRSLDIHFWLAAGSNFSSGGSLQSSWGTQSNVNRTVGQTNLAAAVNNYWQITGVQLEVGETATTFEHKKYATELAECQRYFEHVTLHSTTWNFATDTAKLGGNWHTQKRTVPSITFKDGHLMYGPGGNQAITRISTVDATWNGADFNVHIGGGMTVNTPGVAVVGLQVEAEL